MDGLAYNRLVQIQFCVKDHEWLACEMLVWIEGNLRMLVRHLPNLLLQKMD